MNVSKSEMPLWISLISLIGMTVFPLPVKANLREAGNKAAQVYCYMRENRNPHEVSWKATYALIKRQSNGIFKTSPEHGAVLIVESVVQNPDNFPDCGKYLGDLFDSSETKREMNNTNNEDNRYSF